MPDVTVKDIARIAGVSHTTVSRALSGSSQVKPETRARIVEIAERLNYVPSASARALVSGKTYCIGLLVLFDISRFPSGFVTEILQGIYYELSARSYSLTVFFDQQDGKKGATRPEMLSLSRVDGVFLLTVEANAEIAYRAAEIKVPKVIINQSLPELGIPSVAADDEGGAHKATRHLIDLGHRRIAHISGPLRYSTSVERQRGYRRALRETGAPYVFDLEVEGEFTKSSGYEQMCRLLETSAAPTAVFAANDLMALGALQAICRAGLRVPEDVAVVGFDDQEFASHVDPPITTVRKPRTAMGARSANLMLDILSGSRELKSEGTVMLDTELVVRASSDPSCRSSQHV